MDNAVQCLRESAAGSTAFGEFRKSYNGCPICGHSITTFLCEANCQGHPLWRPPLPTSMKWNTCNQCGHIFTEGFFTENALNYLFSQANEGQIAGGDLDSQRMLWSPVVERVVRALPDQSRNSEGAPCLWLDVGCGSGGLLFTAEEYGFAAIGIDARIQAVRAVKSLGYRAIASDFLSYSGEPNVRVISMADVLEHMPYPVGALRHAHDLLHAGGVLFVSCPNIETSSWRLMSAKGINPYWAEIEHYHNFSRTGLVWLLRQCGFTPVDYSVSVRYKACMQIIALKS